jgi:hypothetical protein
VSGKETKGPFEAPIDKKKARKTRERIVKGRIHIYISEECLNRVDDKSEELGLDRSPCIQMLLNFALNNLQTMPLVASAPSIQEKKPNSPGK